MAGAQGKLSRKERNCNWTRHLDLDLFSAIRKSGLAEHCIVLNHRPFWEHVHVLGRVGQPCDCVIVEA